ncbi:hypothetical protein Ahy_A04g020351 [Arachis hypogaea]|uniref:Transposase MuDR plant domain-containing protein n=1 Tax=Arachis hypogaea TaxID=3818 RepID=A0A445DHF1_ARAHY|nr:hypothetical protein Ahy_A04g020351 [Arachis hypogaea]
MTEAVLGEKRAVFEAYAELKQFGYVQENILALWFKDPIDEDMEENLKLFKGQNQSEPGVDDTVAETRDSDTDDNQEAELGNSGDSDSLDSEYKPYEEEDDSTDDLHFIDSEDELDFDVNGFEDVNVMTDRSRAVKKKGMATKNFENDERTNSDDLDLDHEVGVEGSSSYHEGVRYPVHKAQNDMKQYKWEVGTLYASREKFKDTMMNMMCKPQGKLHLGREDDTWQLRSINLTHTCTQEHMVEILHSKWLGKSFKKKVESNPKCYESVIHPLNGHDLWERIAHCDVMPPPYKRPTHKPVKKRKPAAGEEEQSSRTHFSRTGDKQRCSIYDSVGHNKSRCPKPIEDEDQHSKKLSKGKKKKSSTNSHLLAAKGRSKTASSQPTPKLGLKRKTASAT